MMRWLPVLLLPCQLALADSSNGNGDIMRLDSGMIIDNTITRIGHEFAREFAAWRINYDTGHAAMLTITERPSARWGSMIIIAEGQRILQTLFITPGRMNIRDVAQQSAGTLEERMLQSRLRQAIDGSELGPDELQ